MDKNTTLQAVITAALGALCYYFNIMAVPILILVAVMAVDYTTGMIKAWHGAELSSRKGLWGIVKKLCYMCAVGVGMVLDWLVVSGLAQVNISVPYQMIFGMLVTIWLIINELISILENLAKIGVPLPKFLAYILHKLKVSTEEVIPTKDEKEK